MLYLAYSDYNFANTYLSPCTTFQSFFTPTPFLNSLSDIASRDKSPNTYLLSRPALFTTLTRGPKCFTVY